MKDILSSDYFYQFIEKTMDEIDSFAEKGILPHVKMIGETGASVEYVTISQDGILEFANSGGVEYGNETPPVKMLLLAYVLAKVYSGKNFVRSSIRKFDFNRNRPKFSDDLFLDKIFFLTQFILNEPFTVKDTKVRQISSNKNDVEVHVLQGKLLLINIFYDPDSIYETKNLKEPAKFMAKLKMEGVV